MNGHRPPKEVGLPKQARRKRVLRSLSSARSALEQPAPDLDVAIHVWTSLDPHGEGYDVADLETQYRMLDPDNLMRVCCPEDLECLWSEMIGCNIPGMIVPMNFATDNDVVCALPPDMNAILTRAMDGKSKWSHLDAMFITLTRCASRIFASV